MESIRARTKTSPAFAGRIIPTYELLFCAGSPSDPAVPVVEKLIRDFPDRRIRIIYRAG